MSPTEKTYWVEADRAVKDRTKVIGYSVWRMLNNERTCVRKFRISRRCRDVDALYLANLMRDDLNAPIE